MLDINAHPGLFLLALILLAVAISVAFELHPVAASRRRRRVAKANRDTARYEADTPDVIDYALDLS